MKMLFIMMMAISITACSQDIAATKVPSVVLNTLKAQQPAADKVDWEKKNNMYEAEFDTDSSEVTVQIDASGKLLMQKKDVKIGSLPGAITSIINQQYKDYTIDDAEMVEKNGMVFYQLELNAKGKKDVLLVFNADGAIDKGQVYWD